MQKFDQITRRNFLSLSGNLLALPAFGNVLAQVRPDLSAIKTRADWQRARKQILEGMQLVMGNLPAGNQEPVRFVELEKEDLATFTRTKIKYLAEREDWVMAYLLVPKIRKRRVPVGLCRS